MAAAVRRRAISSSSHGGSRTATPTRGGSAAPPLRRRPRSLRPQQPRQPPTPVKGQRRPETPPMTLTLGVLAHSAPLVASRLRHPTAVEDVLGLSLDLELQCVPTPSGSQCLPPSSGGSTPRSLASQQSISTVDTVSALPFCPGRAPRWSGCAVRDEGTVKEQPSLLGSIPSVGSTPGHASHTSAEDRAASSPPCQDGNCMQEGAAFFPGPAPRRRATSAVLSGAGAAAAAARLRQASEREGRGYSRCGRRFR